MTVTRNDLIALALVVILAAALMAGTTLVIDRYNDGLSTTAQAIIDWLP